MSVHSQTEVVRILAASVDREPGLQPYLVAVAERYFRKGELKGRQQLARHDRDFLSLCDLFGAEALRRDDKGRVTLIYAQLFRALDADVWVRALHDYLQRPLRTAADAAAAEADAVARVLQAWRLLHPERRAIHEWLEARRPYWHKRLQAVDAKTLLDEWTTALALFDYLKEPHTTMAFADLSARFTGDSKALRKGAVLPTAAAWLALSAGIEPPTTEAARKDVLRRFGVVFHHCSITVTVAGPLVYRLGGRHHDWIAAQSELGLPAILSLDVLDAIEGWSVVGQAADIVTCENETPFAALAKTSGDVVVYTQGMPNRAVQTLLGGVVGAGREVRHWGDSDLAGLRIADQLARWVPLSLWRCDVVTLARLQARLLPLSEQQLAEVQAFQARHPDFRFKAELAFTAANGWLEQESWAPAGEEQGQG